MKEKINKEKRCFCFEIYGFDFIVDKNEYVYLIEVNTNPCIEESSSILKVLLPRMLGYIIINKTILSIIIIILYKKIYQI